jgi:AcrR family transcriptional regulator
MRVKSDAKRQAILDAAKSVFEEMGYERASMSEVAARATSSKATLYNYFQSKETLFFALIEYTAGLHSETGITLCDGNDLPPKVREIFTLLDPEADIATVLQNFGEQAISTFHTPSILATMRMVIAASNNSDIGKLFYERGPSKAFKMTEMFFAAAMEAGKLRRADPRIVEMHWRGLLKGSLLESGLYNVQPELTQEEVKNIVTAAVDVFMRAYGPKE